MEKDTKLTRNLYLIVSLFVLAFSIIYELCSHRVYSNYMIFAFTIPLFCGFVPYMFFVIEGKNAYPRPLSSSFYNAGIAAATCGSLFRGIIDIYGTTSHLTRWYWGLSVLLITAGIFMYIAERVYLSSAKDKMT